MDSKKSPKGRKRTSKAGADDGSWDCSVCTFKNNAEAFKCSMCDVRKGTSTRKPRLNPDLVAAQQAQALTPPPAGVAGPAGLPSPLTPIPSSSKSPQPPSTPDAPDEEEEEKTTPLAQMKSAKKPKKEKSETKKTVNKARLKNVDRSSATYHSVTVDDFTVVITEFKPKVKKEPTPKKSSNSSEKDDENGGAGDKDKSEPKSDKNGEKEPKTEPKEEPGSGSSGGSTGSKTADAKQATSGGDANNQNSSASLNMQLSDSNHGRLQELMK